MRVPEFTSSIRDSHNKKIMIMKECSDDDGYDNEVDNIDTNVVNNNY